VQVYRRLPTGLSAAAIRSAASAEPVSARWAALRLAVGIVLVLVPVVVASAWPVMFIGAALVLWALRFSEISRAYEVDLPAMMLRSLVRFGKTRSEAWQIEADDRAGLVNAVRDLTLQLDQKFGPARIAFVDDNLPEPAVFDEVFAHPSRSGILAWAPEGGASVFADDSAEGIWLRSDPTIDGETARTVTVLASTGEMSDALVAAARSVN
jgi:hypothetical protein